MVDSLPPSGIDPDNQTIITNSNDELEVIESRAYLADFDQDSGDWTGIDSVSDGIATVNVPEGETQYASVTADLTGIDVLAFRIEEVGGLDLEFKFDGIKESIINDTNGYATVEISGLDHYGANTTVTLIGDAPSNSGAFYIDYIRSNPIQPESRIVELVDTGGLS